MDLLPFLTKEHFDGAPESDDPEGSFQILFDEDGMYLRNIDTGEITFVENDDD